MKFSFPKGVHPAGYKDLAKESAIAEMRVPNRVYLSLSQHIGAPAECCVAKGDKVKIGTVVGKQIGFVGSNVRSSVSGTVVGVIDRIAADGSMRPHVVVDNDGKEETEYLPPLADPGKEEILERIREAGIVGMGGAGFPTAVKLSPKSPVDTLIINAAECEPYITCDYRIMLEYTREFLTGVQFLRRALGDVKCLIGIEDNKADCIHQLNHFMEINGIKGVEVAVCRTKYPQGAEKQLIYALTRRKVPAGGGLPADVGVIVQNVHTALSVYYAVKEGQPLIRRVMTVTGLGCARPANLWVRIGTPLSEVMEFCGSAATREQAEEKKAALETLKPEEFPSAKAYKKALAQAKAEYEETRDLVVDKLINGGPMMGLAMPSADVATTKTTSCLLMFSHREARAPEPDPCINCSKCVAACPMKLSPNMIESYARQNDFANCEKYGAAECISCGCCAYICPARRPLLQKLAYAKQNILALRKKQAEEEKAAKAPEQERRERENSAREARETTEKEGR